MSEELHQRDLIEKPEKIGKWDFYNIGATTLKSLKENKIIPNLDYKEFERRKPDGIIVFKKNVVAVLENKRPSEFNTEAKKKKAIQQGIEVSQKLKAEILIVTDTKETIWINSLNGNLIKDENGNNLIYNFKKSDENIPKIIEKILESCDENNSQLALPKLKDPSPLAKQVWQDIWSVSGATPENCLYTFVELFIFKYLSDLNVLTGIYNFDNLIKQYETNTSEDVLEFYANTIRKKIKQLFPMNEKDKTTIINGTIFVSKDEKAVEGYSAVFKKILEKFQNEGRLQNIHHDFKSKIFESFLKESISKKNWGQFFTPLKVVRAVSKMVEIKEGMTICDPACGVGKFLLEPILLDIKRFYKIENNKLKPLIKLVGFDKGFDKDEQKTIILAKANMLIYLSDLVKDYSLITEQFSDVFNETFLLKTNSILGTLSENIVEEYDLVLTNPPYVTSGSSNLKEEIVKSGLTTHYKVNATGVEGLFMEWIIRSLKLGGKAFIIVPDGSLKRTNDNKLRKFLIDECFIDCLISLPKNTFFSTPQKTYILGITKKTDKSVSQTEPVFTYLVSDIGETLDVYRFDTENNELDEASNLFNQFKGAKSFFKTKDKRCKVQEFNKFVENINTNWLIDDWWTKDEKIKLGISEEDKVYDLPELINEFKQLQDFLMSEISELEAFKFDIKEVVKYKSVKLSEIVEMQRGNSKYTKSYISSNKGDFPVYSSKTEGEGIMGYTNSFEYDEECLTYTTNGVHAGKVFKRKQHKFSMNGDCAIIRILPKYIDLLDYNFLYFEIQKLLIEKNFNWENKATPNKVYPLNINIPVSKKGVFDINIQKEISKKYEQVETLKSELLNKTNEIKKVTFKL
jgi:type I restriction-modification system DNA methylase subunit